MRLRYLFLLLVLAALTSQAQEQPPQRKGPRIGSSIVDDSTKNVYGPHTTKWISEEDFFFNRDRYQTIDTSINNYHRWTYVQRFNNFYKDLGNVGTSLSSIFPLLPAAIGVSSGFTSYDPYYDTEEPKYFDTKSPYSRMYLVWGGNGRAMTRIEFSRNINSRWNFGFNFHPILVDKQIQKQRKADRQTISYYFDVYSSYKSKDGRYSLLTNFRRIKHRVKENGGVDEVASATLPNRQFDVNARLNLTYAESMELRTNVHLFHQYKVGKALQIYHTADRFKQRNGFKDLKSDSAYFDHVEYRQDSLFDRTQINTFQNEFGVKGNLSRLFYNYYYKVRKFDLMNNRLQNTYGGNVHNYDSGVVYHGYENYVGGRLSLEIDSVTHLTGWAEYLLDGNYRIEGELKTPWLDASLKNSLSKPGFMQNFYRGSHDYWKNFFSNSNSLQVDGFLKGKFGPLFISPGFKYTFLNNYIFFKRNVGANPQKILPFQSKGNQQVVSPELRMEIGFWKHLFIRPNLIYTRFLQNADDALSIPKIFANAQVSFEGFLFKKNLQAQIGFDAHWQSDYYALAYDVATQHFYVQNTNIMKSYLLADVFLNGKIKRGKFFFKYHNIVQAFTQKGYLPTPGYPAQRNILDFGFEILLFD